MKNNKFKIITGIVVFLFIAISIYLVLDNKRPTYATEYVPDDRFEDINFYNCVAETVGEEAVDGEGIIDTTALENIITLDCSSKDIKWSDGIEFMTNLESLNLSDNYLGTINIKSNTALKYVDVSKNVLSSLTVQKNPELLVLYANDNPKLSYVNLTKNSKLKALHLQNTSVGGIITNTGNLSFRLDLTNNVELTELVVNSAHVLELDLTHNTKLEYLDVSNNYLETLDLTYNTNLEEARISDNQLTEIQLYLQNGGSLKRLYLNNNLLTTMKSTTNMINTNLEELYVEDNQINSMDIYYMLGNELNQLWIRGNRFNRLENNTVCAYAINCKIGSHIVTFNTNDGQKGFNINVDNTVTSPIPTKEGYTFLGWYKDQSLTEEFDEYDNITEDITLYAKWQTDNQSNSQSNNSSSSEDSDRVSSSQPSVASGIEKPSVKPDPGSSSKNIGTRNDIAEAGEDDDEYGIGYVDDNDDEYNDDNDENEAENDDNYETADDTNEEYDENNDSKEVNETPGTGDHIYVVLILTIGMLAYGCYYAKKIIENS